ncbi:MAG TPA: hypothetical protein VJT70_09630 [Sphingomicrobium sp.]|nr:hypothetical protein [Sphingomicrobium sp.]
MGEPFRARSEADDTLARWFSQADRNSDGLLTLDEMVADAARFFATLDTNHDREIDPDEIAHYEWEVAPDIQVMSPRRRVQGDRYPRDKQAGLGGRRHHERSRRAERIEAEQLGIGGALQGAARYGLLNIPEPVAAADTDFNRGITLEEFTSAAALRFQFLDSAKQRVLNLPQLQSIRSAALADGRPSQRDNRAGDNRIGNALPRED